MFSSNLIILAPLEWFDCVSGLTREKYRKERKQTKDEMTAKHGPNVAWQTLTNRVTGEIITLIENQGDRRKTGPG